MSSEQIILAAGISIIGILVSAGGYLVYLRTKNTHKWPKTNGQILNSYVKVRNSSWYDGEHIWDSTEHHPYVEYQYQVKGRRFVCKRIGYGGFYEGRKNAERIVFNYQVGDKVVVFFDPYDPGDAVLEPGASKGAMVVLGAGILMIAFGILLIFSFSS